MEDKKLNEQESLELIARMIRNSKRNVRENAGGPALNWVRYGFNFSVGLCRLDVDTSVL